MASGDIIYEYIASFIKIGLVIQKLMGEGFTGTQTAWRLYKSTSIFQSMKIKLEKQRDTKSNIKSFSLFSTEHY
jgi:hypothetical protein